MDFTKLNEVSRVENINTIKMMDLEINKNYHVTDVVQVNTKYGEKIIVTTEDGFRMFLPARISRALINDPEQLQQLKEECKKEHLYLCYLGGKYNSCEFKCL